MDNHPNDPDAGSHEITFSRHLLIERDDFMEDPPPKYHRLYPGNLVRLRGACIVRCTGCKKDADGNVKEVLAEYITGTRGGTSPPGEKVRGTIHWLDEETAVPCEIRLYDLSLIHILVPSKRSIRRFEHAEYNMMKAPISAVLPPRTSKVNDCRSTADTQMIL